MQDPLGPPNSLHHLPLPRPGRLLVHLLPVNLFSGVPIENLDAALPLPANQWTRFALLVFLATFFATLNNFYRRIQELFLLPSFQFLDVKLLVCGHLWRNQLVSFVGFTLEIFEVAVLAQGRGALGRQIGESVLLIEDEGVFAAMGIRPIDDGIVQELAARITDSSIISAIWHTVLIRYHFMC